MPAFHKSYGTAEGPLGLPMSDKQARAVDALLAALPAEDKVLVRVATRKAPTELLDGERADVSWVTTEAMPPEKSMPITCVPGLAGDGEGSGSTDALVTLTMLTVCWTFELSV